MAGGVTPTSIPDLLNSTLRDIERDNVAQTQKYSDYELTNFIFTDRKEASGTALEFDLRIRESGTARFVGLYETTPNIVVNTTVKAQERWSHIEDKVHWDEKELAMNANGAKIYETLKERWNASTETLWNLLEDNLWSIPQTSADEKTVRGLLYHIRTLGVGVSDPVGGFNGITAIYGDGTTDTTWCTTTGGTSLDRNVAENNRIRNFVSTFGGEIDQNFIRTLRTAMNRTGFKRIPGLKGGLPGGNCALVMSEDLEEQHEDLVNRRQVEGSGKDSAPVQNTTARGCQIIRSAPLNNVAFSPIFGIRKDCLQARILAGRWFKRKAAINDRDQVETWTVPIVCSFALRPSNPRGLFVIHKTRTS